MVGVFDIVKLLEQVPIWKDLRELPERVEDLEARLTDLEKRLEQPAKDPGDPCPSCGIYDFRATKTEMAQGPAGDRGIRVHYMKCRACGFEDEKMVAPK